jgi:hypothetical protein
MTEGGNLWDKRQEMEDKQFTPVVSTLVPGISFYEQLGGGGEDSIVHSHGMTGWGQPLGQEAADGRRAVHTCGKYSSTWNTLL